MIVTELLKLAFLPCGCLPPSANQISLWYSQLNRIVWQEFHGSKKQQSIFLVKMEEAVRRATLTVKLFEWKKFNSATRRLTFRRLTIYYLAHPSGKELARSLLETRGWTLRGIWWTICPSHSDGANRCCRCRVCQSQRCLPRKALFSSSRFEPSQLLSSALLGTDSRRTSLYACYLMGGC